MRPRIFSSDACTFSYKRIETSSFNFESVSKVEKCNSGRYTIFIFLSFFFGSHDSALQFSCLRTEQKISGICECNCTVKRSENPFPFPVINNNFICIFLSQYSRRICMIKIKNIPWSDITQRKNTLVKKNIFSFWIY